MDEMEKRGYHPDKIWRDPNWRGSTIGEDTWITEGDGTLCYKDIYEITKRGYVMIYPEHNDKYLQECIENLKEKGVEINIEDLG